jgi:hypothetical protein
MTTERTTKKNIVFVLQDTRAPKIKKVQKAEHAKPAGRQKGHKKLTVKL